MRYSTVSTVCYFTLTISSFGIAITTDFDTKLSIKFLDFAAAAYAENTEPCLSQNNATQVLRIALPCDYMKDECWGIVALTSDWIITSFRGTRTKIQLITELIETMSEPKKLLSSGGSVQHYFYVALKSIWTPIHNTIKKLSKEYPTHKIMFTGHSLGGALASLASTLFAHRHPGLRERIYLMTYGQPRVGNYDYAQAHIKLVPRSWRVVHKYDLVVHLPTCAIHLFSHSCSPFFNHSPYHHGTEIWFPTNMTENALFIVCSGLPVFEDDKCSNGYNFHYRVKDHAYYFEHNVSEYGRFGCYDTQEISAN